MFLFVKWSDRSLNSFYVVDRTWTKCAKVLFFINKHANLWLLAAVVDASIKRKKQTNKGTYRDVVAPPISKGIFKPFLSISLATWIISSKDGVINPDKPMISAFSSIAVCKIFSHGVITPRSITLHVWKRNNCVLIRRKQSRTQFLEETHVKHIMTLYSEWSSFSKEDLVHF